MPESYGSKREKTGATAAVQIRYIRIEGLRLVRRRGIFLLWGLYTTGERRQTVCLLPRVQQHYETEPCVMINVRARVGASVGRGEYSATPKLPFTAITWVTPSGCWKLVAWGRRLVQQQQRHRHMVEQVQRTRGTIAASVRVVPRTISIRAHRPGTGSPYHNSPHR
eukprot:7431250-Pyramimonas_sp.AAC.1